VDSGHIFLSYSTTDRAFADDLLLRLESKGVRVWMAPRDVRPGSDYSEAIQDAIEASTAVVALVSADANRSRHVRAEIEIAFSCGKPLFPVRFHDIAPARGLALFLGLRHWTDLFGANEAGNLDRLAAELTHRPAAAGATAASARPLPARRPPPPSQPPRASTGNRFMIAAICLSLVVILGVVVLAILRNAGAADAAATNESTNGLAYDPGRDRASPVPAPDPVQNVARVVPPPYVPPAPTGADWIVGSWILAGESCSGRDGATYGSDRNWATAGGGGTWSIEGNILTNITYYQIRQGNRVQRGTPMTTHYEALSISPQEVVLLRTRDRVEMRLYRCP
jgi:TIR domain-containing protein